MRGRMVVRGLSAALAVLVAVAGGRGAALAGGGGGGGGTTVSTTGVVAFGVGVSGSTRGTYAMAPNGAGLHGLSTQIYPMDVSRGRSVVTVLLNYTAGQGLCAMRADGTGAPVELIPAATRVTDARFSRDGAHVLHRVIDTSTTPVTSLITLADVVADAGGDVIGLANAAVVYTTTGFLQGMDLSRDGTRIVLSLSSDLWTVTVSSGALTRLTNTVAAEKYPRWSPVDDRVAYTRYDTVGIAVADVLTIDANSGAVRLVMDGNTNFYADNYACWAPDGGNLLFQANKKNVGIDLYQIPSATSGSAVSVTSGSGLQENTPAWGW